MCEQIFTQRPQIELLQWLARGSLKQNLPRSIRLWVLLITLYGDETNRIQVDDSFTFADWRNSFFSSTHPQGEAIPPLHDFNCACAKTTADWIFDRTIGVSQSEWRRSLSLHDATPPKLDKLLKQRLFAVTRRSLQADLQILTKLGWLKRDGHHYQRVTNFPNSPVTGSAKTNNTQFDTYDLALLNLDLADLAQSLKEPIAGEKRFFFEVDYIIHKTNQERVEDWHEKLKQLWALSSVPPIRITYNSAREGVTIKCIVYPVCLYYVRRAIYLCAFGQTPTCKGEWYNYRLDRIQQINQLDWTNEDIPYLLFKHYPNNLPKPDYIREQMEQAWGFDFYEPPKLMLLRFERTFHDRYVQGTFRHDTFKSVSYQQAEQLIRQHTPNQEHQQALLNVLQSRQRSDAYYCVRYRDDDTNVKMRLRAWRPHGEVLMPWELRQKMTAEVSAEAQLYLTF
ncbi:MAG TPA: TIGR03985 family CRISPR-associated protein [Cyanobacteria bacterium UBA11162]|nr:TIGR03985 family CRISPR-associated protein [Cyanobacteria bacterium UBA11162]